MPDLLPVTIGEMIAEVDRELRLRARVYPALIANKKLTQKMADRQTETMRAVLLTLQEQAGQRAA
jgi:hypothetical protein